MVESKTFYPPLMTHWVIWLCRFLMPSICKGPLKGLSFRFEEEDLERLNALRGERLLLLPNHPTPEDPYILFELSTRLGLNFNYVIAREAFAMNHGARGWLFQHVGGYSVMRGAADRESFKTTQNMLIQGKHPLVIFIEGEVSLSNDILIPFEPGVLQLALKAQEHLTKNAAKAGTYTPGIHAAVVAIKYLYAPDVLRAMEKSIADLEIAVGITKGENLSRGQRLRRIGLKVLSVAEDLLDIEFKCENDEEPQRPLDERVITVRNRILSKMEAFLDINPADSVTFLDRIRAVRNKMDRRIYLLDDEHKPSTAYEVRMHNHLRKTFNEFYVDLRRLVNILTLQDGYVSSESEEAEPGHLVELLHRLEIEVFGAARFQYPRTAAVKVGNILDLRSVKEQYESNKKQCAKDLAHQLETEMHQYLQALSPRNGQG